MSNITYKIDTFAGVVEVYDHDQQSSNGFFNVPVCVEIDIDELAKMTRIFQAALEAQRSTGTGEGDF